MLINTEFRYYPTIKDTCDAFIMYTFLVTFWKIFFVLLLFIPLNFDKNRVQIINSLNYYPSQSTKRIVRFKIFVSFNLIN